MEVAMIVDPIMQIRMCTRHRFSWAAVEFIYGSHWQSYNIEFYFLSKLKHMNKYTDIQIIWIAFWFYKFSLSLVPIKPH